MMADGDCPEEEMDCRWPKGLEVSDSFVAERTRSSNCAIEGSCWFGEAADSGEAADEGGWCVCIEGSFSPAESVRPLRCGDIADESTT